MMISSIHPTGGNRTLARSIRVLLERLWLMEATHSD